MDWENQEKADKAFFGKGLFWFTVIGTPVLSIAVLANALNRNWVLTGIFGISLVLSLFNLRRFWAWTHQSD